MSVKKTILLVIGILDAVVVNAAIGLLFYEYAVLNSKASRVPSVPIGSVDQTINTVDVCGAACKAYIEQRVASLSAVKQGAGEPAGPSATPKVVYVPQATAKTKVKTTNYVTVPGTGSTTNNEWTDIPGTEFYFNPDDYVGLQNIYLEANMKLFNGNGMAYVRLFDVTHGVGVQGSDVKTDAQIDGLVVSGQVSFWSGRNLIRVQAKSLTADTAIFTSGRLKIVTEN